MSAHDLTAAPATDPVEIYRYRDGLYAVDMLTAAITGLDLFTFIGDRRFTKQEICKALEIRDRPTDVMLTLFTAMGFLENGGDPDREFSIQTLSLGYVREVGSIGVLGLGLGARGSVSRIPTSLKLAYGTTTPTGLVLFLRVRPKPMTAEELAEMHERMKHAAMGMKMD